MKILSTDSYQFYCNNNALALLQFRKRMKRKRLQLEEPICDTEEFKPDILLTLDNEAPCPNRSIKRIQYTLSGQINSFSKEASLHEHSMHQFIPSHISEKSSNQTVICSKSLTSPNSYFESRLEQTQRRPSKTQHFPPPLLKGKTKSRNSRLLKKAFQLKEGKMSDKMQPGIIANTSYLNNILKHQRTKNIVSNFIKKIRRKKIDQKVLLEMDQMQPKRSFFNIDAFELNKTAQDVMRICHILFTVLLIFFNSTQLVFEDMQIEQLTIFRIVSVCFFFIKFIVGLLTVKQSEGRRFQKLNQIWQYLGCEKIVLDILNLLIMILDLSLNSVVTKILRMFIIVKIPQLLKNLELIQIKLITNNENDKYWSLIKIMLFNFCFAHILAIILSAMVDINPHENWMTVKQIYNSPWYEKYIWSYYWSCNIMLTVGFGDISASNFKEALCLIFLQTFSCIVLAYNVNCVGQLIMNIKSKNQQKKRQIKLLKKITESCSISNQLSWKITNFIEESINLKKNFNFEEQQKFISNMPKYLKYDFFKETYKTVFENMPFFHYLTDKTIYNMAEKIEMVMCHPQQIIRNKNDDFNLWILRSGEVGLICQSKQFDLNGRIMDRIMLKEGDKPFVLSLNFMTKKQLPYEFKSLEYSSFYYMDFHKLIDSLRQSDLDFQYYSFMRDKIKNIPDEFEVKKCQMCQNRFHYKFDCPALHYLANTDKIVFTYLRDMKFHRNQRAFFLRNNTSFQALEAYRYFKEKKEDNSQRSFYASSLMGEEIINRHRTLGFGSGAQVESEDLESKILATYTTNDHYKELKQFIGGMVEKIGLKEDQSDPVWAIKSDSLMDYGKYFQADNPCKVYSKIEQIKNRRKNRFK